MAYTATVPRRQDHRAPPPEYGASGTNAVSLSSSSQYQRTYLGFREL
jgi:hypothetical protein